MSCSNFPYFIYLPFLWKFKVYKKYQIILFYFIILLYKMYYPWKFLSIKCYINDMFFL